MNNKAKIITVLTGSISGGGAEKVCVLVCNELIKRGYGVELWILYLNEAEARSRLHKNIKVIHLNRKYARSSFLKIFRLVTKRKPRFTVAFSPQLATILHIIKLLSGARYTIIGRAINTLSFEYRYETSIWRKYLVDGLVKVIFRYSDAIIAQSKGIKRDLIANYCVREEKIIVIHNPVEIGQEQDRYRTLLNPIKKNHEIIYVGRLEPQKGLHYLLEAFRKTLVRDRTLILRILGKGSQLDSLRYVANEKGISENVVFEGYQTNVYPYYLRAKATVLTSVYEGFPNVLLESIAAGTPVISFNCPSGPSEIIKEGVNGYLIPHLDVDAFSEAISKIVSKNQFDGNQVRSTVRGFQIDRILDQYEMVINRFFS